MDVLKALVARVARAFYEPKYIVILDVLNNSAGASAIREDDLAAALKTPLRDVHKLCGTLKEHRLLKATPQAESKKQDQKPLEKNYYYIDYKAFVDVVKWKMYKMQTNVKNNLRTESENKGYICQVCQKQFTSLEAMSLINPMDGLFYCDMCENILQNNDNADNVKASEKTLSQLQEQSYPIISLLKQTDSIVIPESHVFKPASVGPKVAGTIKSDRELSIAQNTGSGQGEIIIDLQMDNEAARRAKQAEAKEKRQQNELPIWHQRSTVSYDSAGHVPKTENNDLENAEQFEEAGLEEIDADNEDYYTKYYEDLSKDQVLETEDDFNAEEDEEDEGFETVTINENNKRALSQEADEYDENDPNKRVRIGSEEPSEEFEDDEDIPQVSVNGRTLPLTEVTEEDQRDMTAEEYKDYYDKWQEWQDGR